MGALANIPVFGWLWNDESVTLAQVRRALATACGRHLTGGGVSRQDARRAARRLLEQVTHSHARPRDQAALRRLLEESIYEKTADWRRLRNALGSVFDPHGEDRAIGPDGLQVSVDSLMFLFQARVAAIRSLEAFTDRQLEHARATYQETRRRYPTERTRAIDNWLIGRYFEEPTATDLLRSASSDLLTILGIESLEQKQNGE